MDRPMIDLLLYLVLIGGAVAIGGALLHGIIRLAGKIRTLESIRRRREAFSAVRLYRMVEREVPGDLTAAEYERAVRYVIRTASGEIKRRIKKTAPGAANTESSSKEGRPEKDGSLLLQFRRYRQPCQGPRYNGSEVRNRPTAVLDGIPLWMP